MVFSKFEFGEPISKKKNPDLRSTLKKVDAKKENLECLKQSDQAKAEQLIKKEGWKKAIQLAEGLKVKDDPKLIRKSLKREEKRKEKSAKQWKERMDISDKDKQRRQNERLKHLQERHADKNIKKKSRAGFEGKWGNH
jgi:hypothetical protein